MTSPSQAAAASGGVPLLDIQRNMLPLRAELDAALARVCDSGRFILGPECEQLERAIARYCRDRRPWAVLQAATHCCWL